MTAGELLIEMRERGERREHSQRSRSETSDTLPPKLSDLGVTKTQSSRWQAMAALDSDAFEAKVERASTDAYDRMTGRFLKAAEIERVKQHHAEHIEHGCTVNDLAALADSGNRFSVILADPPWTFRTYSENGKGRSPEQHYDCMSLTEIAALPVASLAADDCVLLLWSVMPELPDALEIIKSWGFEYKTCGFVWVKQNETGNGLHTGMGYWTRSNAELCLLATKGAPKRLAFDVHQIILSPVSEHSAKPEEVRHRIERLLPGPYLELFGRKPVAGWTVWGNEIRRDQFPMEADPPPVADSPAVVESIAPPALVDDYLAIPAFLRREAAP